MEAAHRWVGEHRPGTTGCLADRHWCYGLCARFHEKDHTRQATSGVFDPVSFSNNGKRAEALYAASFCALAICGVVVLIYFLGLMNGREAEQRRQAPASYSQSAKSDAQRACVGRNGVTLFDCVYERVEASQEQARGEQDLSAQQKSASAALASAVIALLTLVVTIIGVGYVRLTLKASLEAVAEATKGTGAALAAAEAGMRANQIAEKVGEAQIRPYLLVETSDIKLAITRTGYSSNVAVQVPATNYGNTPAIDPSVSMNCWGHNAEGHLFESYVWKNPLSRSLEEKSMSIGPGKRQDGVWLHTLIDSNLIAQEDRRNAMRMLPQGAQFSANRFLEDDSSYPIALQIDMCFSYLDVYGVLQASEYYRLDCKIERRNELFAARVWKVPYDPQGAGDIYPIGW